MAEWVEHVDLVPCSTALVLSTSGNDTGNHVSSVTESTGGVWTDQTTVLHNHGKPLAELATDDLGYLHADQAGFDAEVRTVLNEPDPEAQYRFFVKGRMDRPANVPADITSVDVAAVFVVRSSAGESVYLRGRRLNTSGTPVSTPGTATVASDGTFTRQTVSMYEPDGTVRLAAAKNQGYLLEVSADPMVPYDIAFMGMRVSWWIYQEPPLELPPTLAPLRQFPRGDALGMSSAMRAWPNASQQATNRHVGGYY